MSYYMQIFFCEKIIFILIQRIDAIMSNVKLEEHVGYTAIFIFSQ